MRVHDSIDLPATVIGVGLGSHEIVRVDRIDPSRRCIVAARVEDLSGFACSPGGPDRAGNESAGFERILVERDFHELVVHVASHLEHVAIVPATGGSELPTLASTPIGSLVPLMAKKGKKTKKAKPTDGTQLIASYKRAYRDYDILDTYEAGIVLTGSEVKSLRDGNAQIAEGYARVRRGEIWIDGVHIPPYTNAIGFGAHDPDRERKLLLNRAEIDKLDQRTSQGGLTIVALRLYWKNGIAKMELGLAKGRTKGDKRQNLAERDADREIETAFNRAQKYQYD